MLYRPFAVEGTDTLGSLIVEVFRTRRRPLNALLLSGGGANGVWSAGILNAWTESRQRPEFDIVTGISTGSLISTFAYIGSEKDEVLKTAYTSVTNDDIFRDRVILTAVLFHDALKTTEPLASLLEKYLSNDVIDKVGDIYRTRKCLLLVGTVDFDTSKFHIWNMGELAGSNDPKRYEMYRRIVLAATAIPVVFTPVVIDNALHVDGGVREQVFGALFAAAAEAAYKTFVQSLPPAELSTRAAATKPIAYLIVNGQLTVPRKCVKRSFPRMVLRALDVMLAEGMVGNLYKSQAMMPEWTFLFSRIPDNYVLGSGSEEFDQGKMKRLYTAGYEWGRTRPWETKVPVPDVSPLPCVND
jgi:predicted acylesterase/phospholipase RssA